jgi:hypothetical protein
LAAEADAGKIFCCATYNLEGDGALALTAHMVFEQLDEIVQSFPNCDLPLTKEAVKKSAKLKEDVYEAAKLPVETTAEFVREKSDELKARRAALRARVQEHEQELRALQNSHDEEDESLETQQLLLVQAAQVAVGAISLATHQSLHLSVGFTYHLSI